MAFELWMRRDGSLRLGPISFLFAPLKARAMKILPIDLVLMAISILFQLGIFGMFVYQVTR